MKIERSALHEAGHAVMHAWLRMENLEAISLQPNPAMQTWGHCLTRSVSLSVFPRWRISSRKEILYLMAGGQGELLYPSAKVAGNRRDWEQAVTIARRLFDASEVKAVQYVSIQEQRARRLIRGPLRPSVEAFAAILVERVELDREETHDLLTGLLGIVDYWDRAFRRVSTASN